MPNKSGFKVAWNVALQLLMTHSYAIKSRIYKILFLNSLGRDVRILIVMAAILGILH